MYTPHVVTLIQLIEDDDMNVAYNATILDGVFLDETAGAKVSNAGALSGDSATLFIPFSVHATDAQSGRDKTFLPPKEFARLDDFSGYWTLEEAGESSAASCYFVKGIVTEAEDYEVMRSKYDSVFDVASVRTLDFGSADMRHWQVSGR